jgi:hypothetical protein
MGPQSAPDVAACLEHAKGQTQWCTVKSAAKELMTADLLYRQDAARFWW